MVVSLYPKWFANGCCLCRRQWSMMADNRLFYVRVPGFLEVSIGQTTKPF
jgi:hypothetical protein